ncbi:MAG: BamA/TamA family outer membrane protein [Bacteroidaceae bacterium]|nr:BamA/TamA family outer membrane protein [Bacteroidaceae bacterium]
MGERIRHKILSGLWAITLLVAAGCSSTKYVPDGAYLLDEVNVHSDNKEVKPADLNIFIRQQPNTKWFNLIKTQLYIYNMSGRDTTKWVNRALRRVGDAPVIFDSFETERSRQEVEKAVRNLGYLGASVDAGTQLKGTKKLVLSYDVKTGRAYKVRSIQYDIPDTTIWNYMRQDSAATLLSEGMNMDINVLDNERARITTLLQQKGYYRFNKEYLTFSADTTRNTHLIDLTMHLEPYRVNADSVQVNHPQYYINQVHFLTEYNALDNGNNAQPEDSMMYKGYPVYYRGKPIIRPRVLVGNQRLQKGELYNGNDVQQTYQNLNRLPVLRYTNIRFEELQRNDTSLVDAYIQLTKNKLRSISFEVEGTNSAGDLGAAAAVSLSNRNLFRGSETLTLRLRGAYEAVSGLQGDYRNESYTELSAEASINFPRILFPFLNHGFVNRIRANTLFELRYNFQLRPEFTRIIASTGWSYQWSFNQQRIRHRIDMVDVNYLYMPWIHPDFKKKYLDDQQNYIVRYNYEDRLIVRSGYTFIYNSRGASMSSNVFNGTSYTLRANIEAAGNWLYALAKITNMRKNKDGEYAIMNIPFAQYIKADFDFAKNIAIDNRNSIAYHLAFGIAFPYGNAKMIPFEKRYFAGGANSVRGWSVRSLGPGSFPGDGNFMNQTGDLKMEGSIEYRSNLFWKLAGAIFIDAGNVWTLRDYESQPGGQFRFNKFYKQIAVAYGIGFRIDLGFFILRFDGGMKAINPAYESGRERYPIIHPRFSRDFAFHFAVGYPF